MAWLHELAEEIPREENEKEKTKDEGEDLAKSTLTVSLAQNDDDDDAKPPKVKREISKIEAKSAEETAVVDDVIKVASKEEVSVEEIHPVASAECDDDDDDDDDEGMMESDGGDFRNVSVKEMKACLVATKDDEKESRV